MIPVSLILYGALAAAVAVGAWKLHDSVWDEGYNARVQEEQVKSAENFRKNERLTASLQAEANRLAQEKDNEIREVNNRLERALGELRNRPERRQLLPQYARSCEGATGAELSRPDAGFLEGEAARANRLRAALGTCYEALDLQRGKKMLLRDHGSGVGAPRGPDA